MPTGKFRRTNKTKRERILVGTGNQAIRNTGFNVTSNDEYGNMTLFLTKDHRA